MSDFALDEIHRLLDAVELAIRRIDGLPARMIDVNEVPELLEVLLEVLGWTNSAYVENNLGIQPSLLSKFVKMRGSIQKHLMLTVANRIRTYLKSQDQTSPGQPAPFLISVRLEESSKRADHLMFQAEKWIIVPERTDIKRKINAIAIMLDSIIQRVGRSNLPIDEQAITAIEKAELIAILETALCVLRSPMVEQGLIQKVAKSLKTTAQKAAEKGMQDGLSSIMNATAERLKELIIAILT